ncbi:MAG: methylated-DNA--[protein]-cysteine S-methyltransferase [Xanthomonadales bacterium]|nr:methylated-DNA--[protein]-cysteine S-methyltransferase [Xanthomonadales bacterium]
MTADEGSAALATPLGRIALRAGPGGLRAIAFVEAGAGGPAAEAMPPAGELLAAAIAELEEYFAGRRRSFALPLDPRGTPFQLKVWRALAAIPYGATLGYGELAARLGRPGGARAVGQALAANPLPIVLPCHRVVAARGLGGYAGGIRVKRWLLAHERARSLAAR